MGIAHFTFGLLAKCSKLSQRILLVALPMRNTEARASFASTISGTDLIVGARSGSVNLLLYGVGGIVLPFIGIKAIDMVLSAFNLV